ncbi:MAG: hypothetical protein K2K56_01650 [Lachnospiraceae bacterium]|nr:hypothetical protein [Lachnospiraceae bacterium]MDE6625055.1 hypothetical protein [Lachnospiraceae bacterium]
MVQEEKVKLMSRIAIYEKHEGRTEIPMNTFYKADYVRLNALKAIVSATIVYILVAALVAVYQVEYILANILKVDYKKLLTVLLLVYAVWVFLYWLIARILYAKRYEDARSNIIIYNHRLKKIQENTEKEVVKTKRGVVVGDDFIDF